MTMDADLKRKAGWAGGMALVVFAPTQFRVMMTDHSQIPFGLFFLASCASLLASFPIIVRWGQERARHQAHAKVQQREAYRASPESHLPHLSD